MNERRRPILFTFTFLATSIIGALVVSLISVFAPQEVQIAVLGAYISALAGLLIAYMEQDRNREAGRMKLLEALRVPIELAPDEKFLTQYADFADALAATASQPDPVLREFALLKLQSLVGEVQLLARGTVQYSATETWRTVYKSLLESLEEQEYQSVAWVKTKGYWQDIPGRGSMQLNFDLVSRGYKIERIAILSDEFWPLDSRLPSAEILPWIEDQERRGIRVSLVRQSHISKEPDLLCDFGVFGDRAVGEQQLDEQGHTTRFILYFDDRTRKLVKDRWERLSVFATPYSEVAGEYVDSDA